MKVPVIAVAQQKGGAGKTTLTAQLAVAWAGAGRRVAAIDIDPQASLSRWFSLRAESAAAAGDLIVSAVSGWRLSGEIERLSRRCDIILIDSPPHAATDAKVAIRAADLMIVPVQPSPLDIWAMEPTLQLAAAEKVPTLIVLNRFSPKALTAADALSALQAAGHSLALTRLGNRSSYPASMALGLGVIETAPGTVAAREIAKLAREIESATGSALAVGSQ